MNYNIINGTVLLDKDGSLKTERRDFWVRDGKITFAAPKRGTDAAQHPAGRQAKAAERPAEYETIDATDMLIMPGLINMHTHAYMTVMRNYADDVDFGEWLFGRVMPVEDRLPKESGYWASLLAFMEMIRTGTTCFVDMHMFHRQSALAAREAGMRAFLGRGLVGEDLYGDGYSRFEEAIEEKEEFECDTIKSILSPHAIYSCSVKLLDQVAQEAAKHSMRKQTHLSESETEVRDCLAKHGKTPVELLYDIGFLDEKTILAHCVQVNDRDMDILKASGAYVVTNPASNAKLGNGFAPVSEMREKGIPVCLGTDGTASNNTLNMFREMGLLSLIHKGIRRDSTAAPADFVIRAATESGARALGMEGQLGTVREGACADLIFLNLKEPSLYPNNNIVSSLCYSANGSEVDTVMIGGKIIMRGKQLLTIDAERVYYEVNKIVEKYL